MHPYSLELLADMTRVQAKYLLDEQRLSARPFEDLITTQTPWQSALGPDASWEGFVARARELLCGTSLPEQERIERFTAFAGPLFARGPLGTAVEHDGRRWFGCFGLQAHPERQAISLHIRNACAPRSPFEDPKQCFRWLAELCAEAESLPFAVKQITCGSWLNDLDVFLALFPPSYTASLVVSPPDSKTGFGWWGQLVDRTGRLHRRRADEVVLRHHFPHPRKSGECPFDEFKAHVSERPQVRGTSERASQG